MITSVKRLLICAFIGMLSGALFAVYYGVVMEIPQVVEIERYRPSEPVWIFSSDGVVIDTIGDEKREWVSLSGMAKCITEAVVSAEDSSFFEHPGISIKGILRAFIRNIIKGRIAEGGSTITQQLIKNTLLSPEKTLKRKLIETLLAMKVEMKLSKEEILELYLNQVYFGNGAYGVKKASEVYFDKSPSMLSYAECALLASLLKSPALYNPFTHPENALKRRNYILKRMLEMGFIKNEDYLSSRQERLPVKPYVGKRRFAPFFTDYVLMELEEKFGREILYNYSSRIYTTLDSKLQKIAEEALKKGLDRLKNRHSRLYSRYKETPQGCIVILSVKSGDVLAMVGGDDYSHTQFNRCIRARRMVGSAIKPFIYTLAIEKGIPQDYKLWDLPLEYRWGGKEWRPENYDGKYRGLVTLREALIHSLNVPTIRLSANLGLSSIAKELTKFGLPYPRDLNLSVALGTILTSPLTLTSSYTTFFNGGLRMKVRVVKKVDMKNGENTKFLSEGKRIVARETAFVVKDMLKGVIKNGTGRFARNYYPFIGGKTGTTQDYRDAWFIGCSDRICVGVWVGMDSNKPLGRGETGAKASGSIFLNIISELQAEYLEIQSGIPQGIVFKKIHLQATRAGDSEEEVAFIKTP